MSGIDIRAIEEGLRDGRIGLEALVGLEPELKRRLEASEKQIEVYKESHRLEFFEPNSRVQSDFINSIRKETFLFGGEGAGKTKPALYKDIMVALGRHKLNKLNLIPTPNIGWVSSEDSEHVIEVIQRGFSELIPRDRLISAKPIAKSTARLRYRIKADNGGISEIIEKSYESGWKKHQGREVNWCHDDEQPPILIYKEHIERLRTKGYYWCSMTPTAVLESGGNLWMYRDIVQRAQADPEFAENVWIGYISKYDNAKYLGEENIRILEKKYGGRDSRDAQVRIYGNWDIWLSRVYDNWQDKEPYVQPDSVFTGIKDNFKTWYMGIDPHPRIPFAIIWVVAVPREENPLCKECKFRTECSIKTHWFVADEHFGDEEAESRYTTADYAKLINIKNATRKIFTAMIDPYSDNNERGSGTTIRRELAMRPYCIATRVWSSGRDAKNNRIEVVRGKFKLCEGGLPQLFILDSCKKTRYQLYNYEFDDWKINDGTKEVKQTTKKINDHLPDALAGVMEKNPVYVDTHRVYPKREILWEEANY